jgi:MtrB/PioB family decaheme-associated outer membrane protein
MKTNKNVFVVSKLTMAVQGALVAMLAMPMGVFADDYDAATLTHPTNSVEIGAEYVPKDSAKFGEYNGLNKKGVDAVGNFSARGGDAYDAYTGGSGTNRWEIKGTDLGTTSRELSGSVNNQGKWSVGIGYDELRHNTSDTYQTPFQGSVGGNNFTLPSNFGVIGTGTGSKPTIPAGSPYLPAAGKTAFQTAPGSNLLTAAQLAAFNTPDVHNDRDNTKFNASYIYDSNWNVKFDFNHLAQSGAKLQGVGGDQTNGNINGAAAFFAGQTPMVIMTPTNYTTDTFNLALNWAGDKGYATASYYGSIFKDGYNSVSFNNPFYNSTAVINTGTLGPFATTTTPYGNDAISTMPSNNFNQLNLTGGYSFTSATKLVGGISYARNTQNDSYSQQDSLAVSVPQSSLNGLVVTTHADLKLTNQTTKDLLLSASLKYNQRDNQTASNPNGYSYYTIQQTPILNNTTAATSVNIPMSNQKTQLDLEGDYRIDKKQKLNLSYGYEQIKRSCNGVTYPQSQPSQVAGNAYNYGLPFYTASTCAEVPDSTENKIAVKYMLKTSNDLNFNAGYGYANRNSTINQYFYNPMQVSGATSSPYPEGYEVPGFVAYFQSSRTEQVVKAGVNWQANEQWSLGLNGRYTDDAYHATYGVQGGHSGSVNLDATYSKDENSSFSAFATQQYSSRDMTNLQNPAGTVAAAASATALSKPAGIATWSNNLTENDLTIGLGAKQGGLLGGKLALSGDLTYSLGKTEYGTQFNYAAATTGGFTCSSAYFETCGSLPTIQNEMLKLKLVGSYKLDKTSNIKVGYLYQHLKSTDYMYNGYQYGSTPSSLLPTNQQAPSYTVNVVSASYVHSF